MKMPEGDWLYHCNFKYRSILYNWKLDRLCCKCPLAIKATTYLCCLTMKWINIRFFFVCLWRLKSLYYAFKLIDWFQFTFSVYSGWSCVGSAPDASRAWRCGCGLRNVSAAWRCAACDALAPHAPVYRWEPMEWYESCNMSHKGQETRTNNLAIRANATRAPLWSK